MSRIVYVNGRFLPHARAMVHVEDRGYQLGDGVYEVWPVVGGSLADAVGHFDRLERSLAELSMSPPMGRSALRIVLTETVRRNLVDYGLAYLQVTRGVARRDHAFPIPPPRPAVVVTAKSIDRSAAEKRAQSGVAVISVPESRWARCDIKTIGLLPNALARTKAREAGAAEAWFVDDLGFVTEGAASNAWIVDQEGALRTRDIQANILRGVTRLTLLDVARKEGLTVNERPFTLEEAKQAREAFITGASALVLPVVTVDGVSVGDGAPGPVAKRLRRLYIDEARRNAS